MKINIFWLDFAVGLFFRGWWCFWQWSLYNQGEWRKEMHTSWVPWEKLSLQTFMPASMSLPNIATDMVLGPMVHTILVFTKAGLGASKVNLKFLLRVAIAQDEWEESGGHRSYKRIDEKRTTQWFTRREGPLHQVGECESGKGNLKAEKGRWRREGRLTAVDCRS